MPVEKRESDFAELEKRALWALEHSEEVEPRETIRHLWTQMRLWHYPSNGQYKSWTVSVSMPPDRDDARPMVREVVWDRPYDWQRLSDLPPRREGEFTDEPTLKVRDSYLPVKELKSLFERVIDLDIRMIGVKEPFGLEGETFGLEGYGPLHGIRLEWWCEGPEEWRDLTTWAAEMRGFLKSCTDFGELEADWEEIRKSV